MSFDENTLEKRRPLWIALSNLFLDTELQDFTLKSIAKIMTESGYSLDEINDILMLEVFPVCIANLHSIAGEWAGFDEDWVVQMITTAKPPNRIRRWMNRRNFWMIEKDWEKILKNYDAMKDDSN